ncbi:MAG TPA: hypothetical protein VF621_14420 [Pyrinomonadaceae bacterium]
MVQPSITKGDRAASGGDGASARVDCCVVGGGPAGALLARVIGLGFKRVRVEQ